MQLNLTTAYSIRCMACLAERDTSVSSSEVSEKISVDREFTLKILRRLRNAGLVRATKGSAGGYTLTAPAEEIPLWKIVEATEDSMYISRVVEPGYTSKVSSDMSHRERSLYHHMQGRIDKLLYGITLKDIVEETFTEPMRKEA